MTLEPPRFKGCPTICEKHGLPSLPSEAALKAFLASQAPSVKVQLIIRCDGCGGYHAFTSANDPSGNSSGTGRSAKELD